MPILSQSSKPPLLEEGSNPSKQIRDPAMRPDLPWVEEEPYHDATILRLKRHTAAKAASGAQLPILSIFH
jgi:hypothetical protein